jgi:hypothetical protein
MRLFNLVTFKTYKFILHLTENYLKRFFFLLRSEESETTSSTQNDLVFVEFEFEFEKLTCPH